jgi:ABC-type antimicrobial peptide transport system permease subunit
MVAGTTAEFIDVRRLTLAQGRFLPTGDWRRGVSEAVIGAKVRDEMFGHESALGQLVRVGDRRFRIVGVLASSGQGLGMNTDELVIVPVAWRRRCSTATPCSGFSSKRAAAKPSSRPRRRSPRSSSSATTAKRT